MFLVAQRVKNPPAMQGTWVQSLGWEDPLEEGMATHSCILAWRIPKDREAWWATSPWSHKESNRTEPITKRRGGVGNKHITWPLSAALLAPPLLIPSSPFFTSRARGVEPTNSPYPASFPQVPLDLDRWVHGQPQQRHPAPGLSPAGLCGVSAPEAGTLPAAAGPAPGHPEWEPAHPAGRGLGDHPAAHAPLPVPAVSHRARLHAGGGAPHPGWPGLTEPGPRQSHLLPGLRRADADVRGPGRGRVLPAGHHGLWPLRGHLPPTPLHSGGDPRAVRAAGPGLLPRWAGESRIKIWRVMIWPCSRLKGLTWAEEQSWDRENIEHISREV